MPTVKLSNGPTRDDQKSSRDDQKSSRDDQKSSRNDQKSSRDDQKSSRDDQKSSRSVKYWKIRKASTQQRPPHISHILDYWKYLIKNQWTSPAWRRRDNMKVSTKDCIDLLGIQVGENTGDFICIKSEITDTRRWAITQTVTFKYLKDNKYYEASYFRPAIPEMVRELQDIKPWDDDEVDFIEVIPVQRTVTVFEKAKK